MAETCIVCLGDVRSVREQATPSALPEHPERQDDAGDDARKSDAKSSLRNTRLTSKRIDDDEIVAHLLPCGHNLHNACLKPWVERANSCPICRATFNTVELSDAIGGTVIDTYGVQDKVQQAVVDPTMVVEEDEIALDWDVPEPCIICERVDESHESMYCDGCDALVHVFCAGFDDMPEVYHCTECAMTLSSATGRTTTRRRRSQRARNARRRGGSNDAAWARVWQAVSRSLDLDLDFPFNDDLAEQRTEEQQREFARWQRRFEVADRQGYAQRLRNIATRLQPPVPVMRPVPESQEEIRAWNAFEKARESQEAPASLRRKRRRSGTPQSIAEPETVEERQLKRPRFRPPPASADNTPIAESSTSAARRAADEPTFLSSLLLEVEQKPSAASPDTSGQHSPRNSSPARSPSSSGSATPRATPPPQPSSPPLCSTILPPMSPPGLTFSPFSPTVQRPDGARGRSGRSAEKGNGVVAGVGNGTGRAASSSPLGGLSYSSKEEIQRMVKLALKPRYQNNELDKDQYTDINRDVSRKMYDLVGDATHLVNEQERARWQGVAEEQVKQAIAALNVSNDSA